MRPARVLASLLLVLLLAAPGAAAQNEAAEPPCLRPVDVRCVVQEAFDEADAALAYGHEVLDYAQDMADWVECQVTFLGWCGNIPPAPLPPHVEADVAASSDCDLYYGCDVGPCAHAAWPHTGPEVDPGTGTCYRAWVFDAAGGVITYGGELLDWLQTVIDWVECGMHLECTPPSNPPGLDITQAAAPAAAPAPAAPDAALPCLRPVDVQCLVEEVLDEADALLAYAVAAVQWGRDVLDWVECSLTSPHFCGTVPSAPLPPYVESSQQATAATADGDCNLHTGCDVGPCAHVQVGPGLVVQPGSATCYVAYVLSLVGELLDDGGALVGWMGDLVEWLECVNNGGGIECDSPPAPPAVLDLDAA